MRKLVLVFLLSATIFRVDGNDARNSTYVEPGATGLKILGVFGHLGKSHFDVFKPLLEELARRGHHVTVLSHFPRNAAESLPNYKDVSLRNASAGVFVEVVDLAAVDHSFLRIFRELSFLRQMGTYACELSLRNPNVRNFLESDEKFDVILTETFNTDCFLGFVHRFKAPFVGISTHQIMPWTSYDLNQPVEIGGIPTVLLGIERPMNFLQRVGNSVVLAFARVVYDTWYSASAQALAREVFGPDVPDLRDIAKTMSGLLINTHYTLHGSTSLPTNVYEIGGLHVPARTKPLPEDIRRFLDDAPNGVLYFNMGSMIRASTLPKEKLDAILSAIGAIPAKVIWKFEAENLPGRPDNVMIRKWLPQFDILRHPNVRCYLGHGGLLGLSEGVYAGVPMILIPIFGDQFHNAAAAATRGVAVVLEYTKLDANVLRNAIDQVFNNSRYRENARRLSKAYRDRPSSPLETAVWFTEHVARGYDLPFLRSEGVELPWYQRNNLDVTLFFVLLALLNVYLVLRFASFFSRLLHERSAAQQWKEAKSVKSD